MEIPIYRCQDPECGHEFDSREFPGGVMVELRYPKGYKMPNDPEPTGPVPTSGKRMPACPKCGMVFARMAFTRYFCDCEGCTETKDDLPEYWFKSSFTVLRWTPVFHFEKGKLVRGDVTGNTRAGNFETLPSCPQTMVYCSFAHMLEQQERQYAYLVEAMK